MGRNREKVETGFNKSEDRVWTGFCQRSELFGVVQEKIS